MTVCFSFWGNYGIKNHQFSMECCSKTRCSALSLDVFSTFFMDLPSRLLCFGAQFMKIHSFQRSVAPKQDVCEFGGAGGHCGDLVGHLGGLGDHFRSPGGHCGSPRGHFGGPRVSFRRPWAPFWSSLGRLWDPEGDLWDGFGSLKVTL